MNRNTDPDLMEQFIRPLLDKTLIPAEVKKNPPVYYWPEVNDYTMSCGIAQTPKGRIWLAWFAGGDDHRAVLLMAKSDDGGDTFSKPQFIIDPGFVDCGIHMSAVVANLWTAPDGRLFVFFTVSLGYYDGRAGSWFAVCDNPDSDDPEWSTPQRIGHGTSLNKPTVLSDGTWLFGVSLWRREHIRMGSIPDRLYRELDDQRMANVYESKDQGKTWTRIGGVRGLYPTFDEHMIVERYGVSYPDGYQTEDGRIFIQYDWMRDKGEIMLAIFREEDILTGKAVSPDTKLKHPIMQSWTAAHSK